MPSDQEPTFTHERIPTAWQRVRWSVLVLVAVLATWGFWVTREAPPPAAPPVPPLTVSRDARADFFNQEIYPLLLAHERTNLAAADRAIVRINELFASFQKGVEPFTKDITGIGSRFGILRRMPADWWYEDHRVRLYVEEKFQKHLFSEARLNRDITAVLNSFAEDIQANQNRVLIQVEEALTLQHAPTMTAPDLAQYEQQVREILFEFGTARARENVYDGLATLVAGEVAAITVTHIVVRLLGTSATAAVTSTASGGGAAAGGAAAGGTTGSLGGPVGIAIGVGAGLAIGVIVDWWMTERFRAQLTEELTGFINDLRDGLLNGHAGEEGFRDALYRYCDDLNAAQSSTLHRTLLRS